MIRTALVTFAAFLMLGMTIGCNSEPGPPTTRTDRPEGLERGGPPVGGPPEESGENQTPPVEEQ